MYDIETGTLVKHWIINKFICVIEVPISITPDLIKDALATFRTIDFLGSRVETECGLTYWFVITVTYEFFQPPIHIFFIWRLLS